MTSSTSSKVARLAQAPDFETLIEAAGDLIYTLDLEGRFTFFNQAVERVLGYSAAEMMGRPFTELPMKSRRCRRLCMKSLNV